MPDLPCSVESNSDAALLRAFAADGSESALRKLIDRYSGLVLSTAERVIGCGNLAADAAAITFAIMARKAAHLRGCDCLGRWLHRTVTYEAAKITRRERRHQRKLAALAKANPESHNLTSIMATALEEPVWQEMVPHLDRAIETLSVGDRQLIMDRFYRDHSLKEIAMRMGLGEAALQKRSQRVIRKLAGILRKRGVTSATTSVLVSGMSLQFAKPMLASVTNTTLTQTAIQSASTMSLANLLSNTYITMSTMKSAATCGAITLALSCIPLDWQRVLIAQERQALENLETTNVQLRAQADMPKVQGQATKLQGIAGLLRRVSPSGGRANAIDLQKFAEDLDKMHQNDLIAAARALRSKKGIMEMPPDEYRALLKRVPTLDLTAEKHALLVDFLTDERKTEYPAIILDILTAILSEDRGYAHHSIVRSMGKMLTHLAKKDPAAAMQWLTTVEAENLFEIPSTGPGGPYVGDPLPRLRDCLFKATIDNDPQPSHRTN